MIKFIRRLFGQSSEKTGTPKVEIIGVHKVRSREHCHLIEIIIHGNAGPVNMAKITQKLSGKPESSWQVPYEDKFLDSEGKVITGDVMLDGMERPELWEGEVRIAFFFHYLQPTKPLRTPFGEVKLPEITPRPKRLMFMKYLPVD